MADTTESPNQAIANTADDATPDDMTPQDRLAHLTAKATAEYAVKHYNEAAELYSQATEIQAELNGDMAIENADLLYAYGKCLFFLAQQTSSVLGGTAASAQLTAKKEKKAPKKRKINGTQTNGEASSSKVEVTRIGDDAVPKVADVVPEEDIKPESATESDKPYFKIEGDAPGWDSDEDEDEEAPEQPEEDEEEGQDDMSDAYEMLDLARIIYLKKLDQSEQSALDQSEKGKYVASINLDPSVKEVKTRIADIHDLQAEILLEGEKYAEAVEDLQKCLALKEELELPGSALLAECHYKLSLALEFKSQSQGRDNDGNPVGDIVVDWKIRNESIAQQEKAIESCKLRIAKETKEMEALEAGKEKDKMMAQIEDVQDMVSEMEQRLADLRKPPVNVKEETMMKEQLSGVLGEIFGASAEEQKATLAKAAAGAADISGLVKKKKVKPAVDGGDSGFGSAASTPVAEVVAGSSKVNGKRKVEFMEGTEELGKGKKARVEDAEDSGL